MIAWIPLILSIQEMYQNYLLNKSINFVETIQLLLRGQGENNIFHQEEI